MIDRVTAKLGRKLYEVPVGFKWFVDGLLDGSLGFGGEESAGRRSSVWMAVSGRRTKMELSRLCWRRRSRRGWAAIPARSTANSRASSASLFTTALRRLPLRNKRELLAKLSPAAGSVHRIWRAKKIQTILTRAPGNGAPIGGLKVAAESGWFAARPSGTENIYKIYAESFRGADHLRRILEEAQTIVSDALAACLANPKES
jgi:phosphoglucomutase